MTLRRKLGVFVLAFIVAVPACVYWLLGTESGTRFLLARSESYLPEELVLGTASGSLLSQVCLDSVGWKSDSQNVTARNACVEIDLAPLLSRHLAVRSLDVEEIVIEVGETAGAESSGELPAIDIPLQVSVDTSSLRNLSFKRAQPQRDVDDIRFSGSLSGSKLDVSGLSVRSSWLNADLNGRITIAGAYPGNLDLSWQWTESPSLQLAGKLELRGDLQRYELKHILSAPQLISTAGSFSYVAGQLVLDLASTWKAIEWRTGESLLQSSGGSLRLQGEPSQLDVAFDAVGNLDDLPETRVVLDGRMGVDSIQFSQLKASNDLGQLIASGNARWAPVPAFDVEYALSNLDPSLASALLQGRVGASGKASGKFVSDDPELTVLISKLDGVINGHPLNGSAELNYATNQLSVSDGRFQLGSNRFDVSGKFGNTLSLDAALELPAIDELLPDASGRLSGTLSLRGSIEQPEIRIKADGADVVWTEYTIGKLSVTADMSPSQGVAADVDLRELVVGDDEIDFAHVVVAGTLEKHSVQTELSGKGSQVTADANGHYSEGRWTGTVNSLLIDNEIAGRWSLRDMADVTASRDEFSLSRVCLVRSMETGMACVETTVDRLGSIVFDMKIENLPLALLPLALPQNVELSGFGNVQASGSLVDGRLTGDGSVNLLEAKIDATVDDEQLSAIFTQAAGQATVANNRLVSSLEFELADGAGSTRADLTVEDILDTGSAIAGSGDVAINEMSVFAVLIPDIANPRGSITGNLTVAGTLGRPEILGGIAVSDGAFGVRQAGIEITEINARLSQSSSGHLRLEGNAKSGDGQISIQGDTWVSAESGIRSEVTLTGQDFELARMPDLQLAASPSIEIVFDDRATTVTGNLLVPTANIRMKEIPESATSPSPDAIVHEEFGEKSSVRRRVDLDVAVGLGEEVSFSGFGLATKIDGTVRLRGGTHEPYTGTGSLSLREGRYKAYGQNLEIERGQLIFNGPLENPQLDIRAVRRTTDVVAGIQLSGTPTQLRSNLFSEPALGDAEALSYLLTGRPLASATSSGEGDTLNAAAFALGVSGAGSIVSQVRSGLGLETLAVEGGAEDGRLIAGKRFGSRLLVEYGYGLIDKLGTLLLRYQLTDRIILESRTGTVSNFDILYSVKKK